MFKKIVLFSFLATTSFSVLAQNKQFTIKGKFTDDNFRNQTLYIQKLDDAQQGAINLDSIRIEGQEFLYKGSFNDQTPTMLFATVKDNEGNKRNVLFSPEEGEVVMTIGEKSVVGGTPRNVEVQAFLDLQTNLGKELSEINSRYSKLDNSEENYQLMSVEIESVRSRLAEATYKFAKSNANNDMGEYIMISFYSILSPTQMQDLLNHTRTEFRESEIGKEILIYTDAMLMRSGEGSYKDITLQNPEGKKVALSDYVGKSKLVLFDFWASWCAPCIKEMPNLVEFYKTYKDRGLQIVGISLDEKEGSWKSAIDRLDMSWPQMSDLGGWNSSAAKQYGVSSIPYMMLVDENGNIVDTFMSTEELFDKVKELLD